jgi:hypothetical protein
MIAFLTICYSLLYVLLFKKLKVIPTNNGTISAFVGVGVVMLGGIVFAWYTFAPISQDAKLFRYTIPIVSNVRGLIEEVHVEPFKPMQKGEPLFRINPAPYEYRVKQVQASIKQFEAQRTLASLQVEMTFDDSREKATVTVTGPDFKDVWHWSGPEERFSPSVLRGTVNGEMIELTEADTAGETPPW